MHIRISLEGVGNVQWVQEVAFVDNTQDSLQQKWGIGG